MTKIDIHSDIFDIFSHIRTCSVRRMVRRGCDRNTGERRLIREFETDEDQGRREWMQRRCERSNSASSSKLRACWRHVRFRRPADCYRYPNDSRQETAYRFRPLRRFFFPPSRPLISRSNCSKFRFLSRFCRCRRLNDVFAREKISLIIPRFLFACIKQAMVVFIFLPILHKKKKFNNF